MSLETEGSLEYLEIFTVCLTGRWWIVLQAWCHYDFSVCLCMRKDLGWRSNCGIVLRVDISKIVVSLVSRFGSCL